MIVRNTLHENKLIDLDSLLRNNEIGCINRLKLQKYYAQLKRAWIMILVEYTVYNNGPYSPELANYYYEKIDFNTMDVDA